ncbi:collagen alpha-1(I) chain-like [Ornithorhynchus anatinus]|uniref:collagen alpha-1(I) chain-like n=1 Tax=Ornithorhynchus anatinus TaxID=9258 RepID=UPI0019D41917|nr:collagen alpha-1(I) chain-like [Ornithorhynchus anatinus]
MWPRPVFPDLRSHKHSEDPSREHERTALAPPPPPAGPEGEERPRRGRTEAVTGEGRRRPRHRTPPVLWTALRSRGGRPFRGRLSRIGERWLSEAPVRLRRPQRGAVTAPAAEGRTGCRHRLAGGNSGRPISRNFYSSRQPEHLSSSHGPRFSLSKRKTAIRATDSGEGSGIYRAPERAERNGRHAGRKRLPTSPGRGEGHPSADHETGGDGLPDPYDPGFLAAPKRSPAELTERRPSAATSPPVGGDAAAGASRSADADPRGSPITGNATTGRRRHGRQVKKQKPLHPNSELSTGPPSPPATRRRPAGHAAQRTAGARSIRPNERSDLRRPGTVGRLDPGGGQAPRRRGKKKPHRKTVLPKRAGPRRSGGKSQDCRSTRLGPRPLAEGKERNDRNNANDADDGIPRRAAHPGPGVPPGWPSPGPVPTPTPRSSRRSLGRFLFGVGGRAGEPEGGEVSAPVSVRRTSPGDSGRGTGGPGHLAARLRDGTEPGGAAPGLPLSRQKEQGVSGDEALFPPAGPSLPGPPGPPSPTPGSPTFLSPEPPGEAPTKRDPGPPPFVAAAGTQRRTAARRTGRDGTGRDGKGPDRMGKDRTGPDTTGKERKDRKGADGTGQEWTESDKTGRDRTGQDGKGVDGTGRDRTGQVGKGVDRTGQDGKGPDRTRWERSGPDGTGRDPLISTRGRPEVRSPGPPSLPPSLRQEPPAHSPRWPDGRGTAPPELHDCKLPDGRR